MPATYNLIESQTVTGSAVSAVQFSTIPSTYSDLIVVVSTKQTGTPTGTDAFVTLNGNGASIYSRTIILGDGTNATSSRATNMDRGYFPLSPGTGNIVTMIFNFINYSNTTSNKAMLMRYNEPGAATYAGGYLFASTAAISTIAFTASDRMGAGTPDSWDVGSTFRLYGILAGA